jgi:hypothetical protein
MELFILCIKEIQHHRKIAFHKGHTYICNYSSGKKFFLIGDDDSRETFPKEYFDEHFRIIFPVMEHLK